MDNKDPNPLTDELVAAIPALRAFAITLCGDRTAADDLVQETLVKAWNKFDTFQPGTNMRAWLFRILRNTYFSELRRRRNETAHVNSLPEEALTVRPEQPGHVELLEFSDAMRELPDERREALILVGAVGLTYKEAAQICGCEPGTVKSRVSRARAELARILHHAPEDEPVM